MQGVIKAIDEVFAISDSDDRLSRIICSESLNASDAATLFSSDMYIDATTAILVTDGSCRTEINMHSAEVAADTAIVLSASHLFRISGCTSDFRAVCLMVGEEFMNDMDSTDMIYRRIRYGVRLYDNPLVYLSAAESSLLAERMIEIGRAIANRRHLHRRDVVLNRLFAFYLDLSDIIDRRDPIAPTEHAARYESTVKRFIELLTASYRAEHNVGFYASKLNISAHYLTLIVKEVTGRSVSDFIFGMLYSDARALLSESHMSIQEITALLNFSDQSSFGKFFKRRSGLSPLDYRKKRH